MQVGDAVLGELILGEEICREGIALRFLRQIVQGEGNAVASGALGIVSQLRFDLPVGGRDGGAVVHFNVDVGGNGGPNVGQTGSLLQDGPVISPGGFLPERYGGGHQQALGQLSGRQAGLLRQVVFPDVLRRQGDHTGHLGRGHGGAGHIFIGLPARRLTVDGIDVAAGRRDLRLQLQTAGNAPGAEAAHDIRIGLEVSRGDLVSYGERALIVENLSVLSGNGCGVGAQDRPVGLGDGDEGRRIPVIREVHLDGTGLIVVHHGGDGSGGYGVVSFFIKGNVTAPGANHDFSLNCAAQGGEILRRAEAVQVEIGLFAGQGGHGLVAVFRLGVEQEAAAGVQIHTGVAAVVHRSHGQGVIEGAGHPGGGHAHIPGVQVLRGVVAVFHPCAGVSGGHGGHNAAVGQAVQDGLIRIVGIPAVAGAAGAQGQVYGVAAQYNGVFDGGHVV